MPPDPEIIATMRRQRAALLAREAETLREMARRWLDVERELQAQIELLARDMAELRAMGVPAIQSTLSRLKRYRELLPQVRRQLEQYGDYTVRVVTDQQRSYVQLGLLDAQEAISAAQPITIGVFFNRLPVSAVETMIGLAGDGSPLRALLTATWPDTVGALTDTLVKGTALGWNPRKTAVAMQQAMGGRGLQRALTIARTETLRVHREATRLQYEQSGVVTAYQRMCAHDERVCPACLFSEGKIYLTKATMEIHPNDRCTLIPILKGSDPVEWQHGEAWFREQPDAMQRSILGPGAYAAWQEGRLDLADLPRTHVDPTWGPTLSVNPLRESIRQ
jgi:SPP1 gp7 family putative phage head morphogenesis protein